MALTKVSPSLFQVSNNITSVTVGGSANTISLTFDSNGVITGASNNALSVANTLITGNIVSSQITSVANTQITGNIASSQITSNPTFYGNVSVTGVIGVGGATPSTSGSGISFPATQSTSTNANTLDDYEEGTWTPTLLISSSSTGITQSSSVGSYVKIGCSVTCVFQISLTNKGSNTGQVQLVLPFEQRNQSDLYGNCFLYAASLANDCRSTSLQLSSNSATVTFLKGLGSTAADSAILGTDCTNSSTFRASFSYISNF